MSNGIFLTEEKRQMLIRNSEETVQTMSILSKNMTKIQEIHRIQVKQEFARGFSMGILLCGAIVLLVTVVSSAL